MQTHKQMKALHTVSNDINSYTHKVQFFHIWECIYENCERKIFSGKTMYQSMWVKCSAKFKIPRKTTSFGQMQACLLLFDEQNPMKRASFFRIKATFNTQKNFNCPTQTQKPETLMRNTLLSPFKHFTTQNPSTNLNTLELKSRFCNTLPF